MFKKIILFIFAVAIVSCQNVSSSKSSNAVSNGNSASYTKEFPEFGFSITTPCPLNDVSSQSSGNFEANFGGISNQEDRENMAAYQVIVSKLPIGYKDLSTIELENFIDKTISERMENFKNVKRISFSDDGYLGYVGDAESNGLKQRGVIFSKGRYIIALTVLSNSNLVEKFNKFTNGFRVLSDEGENMVKSPSLNANSSITRKSLALGVSVETPCKMIRHEGDSYSWSGIIDENDKDGEIYRVAITPFPTKYCNMGEYDKQTIKNNIMTYVKGKSNYSKSNIKTPNYLAYNLSFVEDGYKTKECIILTDKFTIELILFSSKSVSDSHFNAFVSSLKVE